MILWGDALQLFFFHACWFSSEFPGATHEVRDGYGGKALSINKCRTDEKAMVSISASESDDEASVLSLYHENSDNQNVFHQLSHQAEHNRLCNAEFYSASKALPCAVVRAHFHTANDLIVGSKCKANCQKCHSGASRLIKFKELSLVRWYERNWKSISRSSSNVSRMKILNFWIFLLWMKSWNSMMIKRSLMVTKYL